MSCQAAIRAQDVLSLLATDYFTSYGCERKSLGNRVQDLGKVRLVSHPVLYRLREFFAWIPRRLSWGVEPLEKVSENR